MRWLLGFLVVCALGVQPLIGCAPEEWIDSCEGGCPDDGNECTEEGCHIGRCERWPAINGRECTFDGVIGVCVSGVCGEDLCEDDGDLCTGDTCDYVDGTCVHPHRVCGYDEMSAPIRCAIQRRDATSPRLRTGENAITLLLVTPGCAKPVFAWSLATLHTIKSRSAPSGDVKRTSAVPALFTVDCSARAAPQTPPRRTNEKPPRFRAGLFVAPPTCWSLLLWFAGAVDAEAPHHRGAAQAAAWCPIFGFGAVMGIVFTGTVDANSVKVQGGDPVVA